MDLYVESQDLVDCEEDCHQTGCQNDARIDLVQFVEPQTHTEEQEQVERPDHLSE